MCVPQKLQIEGVTQMRLTLIDKKMPMMSHFSFLHFKRNYSFLLNSLWGLHNQELGIEQLLRNNRTNVRLPPPKGQKTISRPYIPCIKSVFTTNERCKNASLLAWYYSSNLTVNFGTPWTRLNWAARRNSVNLEYHSCTLRALKKRKRYNQCKPSCV